MHASSDPQWSWSLASSLNPLSFGHPLPPPLPAPTLHTGDFSSGDGEHVRVSGLGYSPSTPALGLFYLLNFTEMHAIPHSLTSHLMSGGDAKQFLMFWANFFFFFFLLPGSRIEVSISLTTASSEFLPLPFWTLSALYFANLHSILCWLSPDQKTTSYSVIHSNSIFCSHDCECNSRPTYAYFKKILTNLANITSVLLAAWSTLRSFDITAFPLSWASSSSWAGLSPP